MNVKSIALSNNQSWKQILVFFLSGRLRQILLFISEVIFQQL